MIRLYTVLAVLLALTLLGCGEDDPARTTTAPDQVTTSTSPDTENTTTSATGETTTTVETGSEGIVVAIDGNGRVVVLDADTGEELRELLDGIRVDDPAKNAIEVSPDGRTAYVVRPPSPGDGASQSEILRVPTSGDEQAEVLVEGTNPAVDPNGETLAYVDYVEGDMLPEPVLVLRDLESGQERRLARNEPFFSIAHVDWTNDGSQVVFTAGEIHLGLYAVDASADDLDEARRLGPTARGEDASWVDATSFGEDRLAVVEARGDPPGEEGSLVIAVNIPQASAEGGLLPSEALDVSRVDSGPSGEELLLVVIERPGEGRLLRWSGGTAEPSLVAEGIVAAAW